MASTTLAVDTKGQTSPIFALPPELLLAICEYTTVKGHDNLSRTCRYLTSILQGYLFQRSDPKDGYGAVRYGCRTGNIDVLRRSLDYCLPPDVNDIILDGKSVLAAAGYYGRENAVQFLLDRGADPNQSGPGGLTPLAYVMHGLRSHFVNDTTWPIPRKTGTDFKGVILALLDAGASPRCELPVGFQNPWEATTPVMYIVIAEGYELLSRQEAMPVIVKMVEKGADLSHPPGPLIRNGIRPKTPIQWAFYDFEQFGSDFVSSLLTSGGVTDFTDKEIQYAAVEAAVRGCQVQALDYLLSRGADISAVVNERPSPLWLAVEAEDPDTVPIILKHGGNPNFEEARSAQVYSQTVRLSTAFRLAVARCVASLEDVDRKKILESLLDYGADAASADDTGVTPLTLALSSGSDDSEALALSAGSIDCEAPLYVVDLLLNHGANPDHCNDVGQTALMAVITGDWNTRDYRPVDRLHLVGRLIEAGADVNFESPLNGRTPLQTVFRRCYSKLTGISDLGNVKKLYDKKVEHLEDRHISADAAVNLSDTPIDDVQWNEPVVPILLKAGAGVSQAFLNFFERGLSTGEFSTG